MRAVVFSEFGPPEVLKLKEVDRPIPAANEVLIKVHATTVTKYDCWVRSNTAPPGFNVVMRIVSGRKPKQPILGTELAGEVSAAGEKVTRFKPGDEVYAFAGMNLGASAEFTCLPEEAVAPKPANVSFEGAAAVLQGGLTALFFLRKAKIRPGHKVLIFGASGGVGGCAVQLAKRHFGAEVTGVCSTPKIGYVRSLGADLVIDYTRQDFTRTGEVYDVVFDTVGRTSIARTRRSLKENGTYLLATFGLPMLLQVLWFSTLGSQHFEYGLLKATADDLILLKDLVEAGALTPVIDRSYPLEAAAEAHRYVESGQKIGNVVLRVVRASQDR